MTQRTLAAVLAVPLLIALGVYAAVNPLPYVIYGPGLTVDVLGQSSGKDIIAVQGHPVYRDQGQLRMTTVSVTERNSRLDLFTLMRTWFTRDDALYPRAVIYPQGGSQAEDTQQGQVEMTTSQDTATAAALTELGYDLHPAIEIVSVDPAMPATGKLQVRDILRKVGDVDITAKSDVGALVAAVPAGQPVPITVSRDGRLRSFDLTPVTKDGHKIVGIQLQLGYTFPFKVSVGIPDDIGGPSAGLMFSLAIYDTLTPGSLTGGENIAGTGTIAADGKVGEIGGIQQKIAGAYGDGVRVFLVPAANCEEAAGSSLADDVELIKVSTLDEAVKALTALESGSAVGITRCGS